MVFGEEQILDRLKEAFPGAIIDTAGADCNFEVFIISDDFAGQGLLQRQKHVLGLFKDELGDGRLHALSVIAKTPDEQNVASQQVHVTLDDIIK